MIVDCDLPTLFLVTDTLPFSHVDTAVSRRSYGRREPVRVRACFVSCGEPFVDHGDVAGSFVADGGLVVPGRRSPVACELADAAFGGVALAVVARIEPLRAATGLAASVVMGGWVGRP